MKVERQPVSSAAVSVLSLRVSLKHMKEPKKAEIAARRRAIAHSASGTTGLQERTNHKTKDTRATAAKERMRHGRKSSSGGQDPAEQPPVVMEKPDEHEPQSGPVLFCAQVLFSEQAPSAHRYTRALPHVTPFSAEHSSVVLLEASKRRSGRLSSRAHTYAVETCGRRVHRMGLS